MALRGTRGRFSDDDYVASGKSLLSSRLKKLGKNPTNIVGYLSYLSNIKDEKKMQDKSCFFRIVMIYSNHHKHTAD